MKLGKIILLSLGLFVAEIFCCFVALFIYFLVLTNIFHTYSSSLEFLPLLPMLVFAFIFPIAAKTHTIKDALVRGTIWAAIHIILVIIILLLNKASILAELPMVIVVLLLAFFGPFIYLAVYNLANRRTTAQRQ
jgi:hypothetical protein